MRRRRNVATNAGTTGTPTPEIVFSAPVVNELVNDPATTSATPTVTDAAGVEGAGNTPARRIRTRTTSRRAVAESEPEANPEPTAVPPEPMATPEAEARPRRSRRRPPATPDPAMAEAPPASEPAPVEVTPPESPKTTNRRRTRKSATTQEASSEIVEAVTEPKGAATPQPISTVEPAVASALQPHPPVMSPTPQETLLTAPGPIVTSSPVGIAPILIPNVGYKPVSVAPSGQKRTRGLRNAPVITTTTLVPVAPAVSPAVGVDSPASRRVRGLRRSVNPKIIRDGTATEILPLTPETGKVSPVAPEVSTAYQPLAAEVPERLPRGEIRRFRNLPQLVVNDIPRLPLLFFVNTEDNEGREVAVRQIRMAYEAGIRLFSLLAHLPWMGRSGERRFEPLEESLQLIAENAPDALVMPRLIYSPATSWVRANEGEMTRYQDGETGDVSLASKAFWEEEAVAATHAAVEYVAQSEHAHRVFGFYLEHGEWFYEKGRGYDYSAPNESAFRSWLRQKYQNSQVALRSAWYDGGVTFETARVPASPPPAGPTLFFSAREQCYTDYHEFASDLVAQVIRRLGSAVKEASAGRSLVAVSYGYTLELARAGSGHLALATLLASEAVDILTGPLSYNARTPGGSAPIPVPLDSIHLAGKLYISEDDTKTYLAEENDTPDAYNPKIESFEETWSVHSRNLGAALARGAGLSWMDLWGMGWLGDRELWSSLSRLRSIAEGLTQLRWQEGRPDFPDPDVAVIVDERAFFSVRGEEGILEALITGQRDTLLRSGARVGFYLLSDLLKPDFPKRPRLFLFLNAFRLPEEIRAVIRERYQDNGRTLAWVYGPGACEPNLSELTDVIGMQLRLQPWGSKIGTFILSNIRSPLTDALRGQKTIGSETRTNPSFYVVDSKAQVLGEYSNGNPSLAYRKHPRWQSVFIAEPSLPLGLLRGLYTLAGVPFFTTEDDVTWVGENVLCLHSARGGWLNVYLREEAALYDILNDEVLAKNGHGARVSMPARGTRLLFFGSTDEIRALGGEPDYAPPGFSVEELPPLLSFTFDEAALPPVPDPGTDDVELLEAALSGDLPIPDKDEQDADDTEANGDGTGDSNGKRKRRRRRRGRGRTSDAADSPDSEEIPDGESAPLIVAATRAADTLLPELETALTAPPGPRRPSLEELLPLSDIPTGAELPPIPEEFLPLDPFSLGEEEEAGRRRRPRRTRNRRGETEVPTPLPTPVEPTPVVDRPVSLLLDLLPLDGEVSAVATGEVITTQEVTEDGEILTTAEPDEAPLTGEDVEAPSGESVLVEAETLVTDQAINTSVILAPGDTSVETRYSEDNPDAPTEPEAQSAGTSGRASG